jgi:hypothetical protein
MSAVHLAPRSPTTGDPRSGPTPEPSLHAFDLSSIPSLQPTRLKFRYQREGRRLSVKGSDCVRDMAAIKGLIRRGLIPGDLEAITHMAPSGVISIFRAHRLTELVAG